MLGELFLPMDMPEAPKESFFKGLFGGGVRNLDREELCELFIDLFKKNHRMFTICNLRVLHFELRHSNKNINIK